MIPFGPWVPDMSKIGPEQLRVARNVIPRDAGTYSPWSGFTQWATNAMDARARGMFGARATDGSAYIFGGTAAKLWENHTGGTLADVTNVGGAYTTGDEQFWYFTQYGDTIIATNYADNIQSYVMGTSSNFADLAGSPPRAYYATTWRDFLVVAHTYDATDGERANRVWWSENGVITSWPTVGTAEAEAAESGLRDLPKGGRITGLAGATGGADGVVFTQETIYRADYIGPTETWQINDIENARGTNYPNAIVPFSNMIAYCSNEGLFVFDGTRSEPIGAHKIDKTFFRDFDSKYPERLYGAVDTVNKLVIWLYPRQTATIAGTPERALAWCYVDGRFSEIEIDAHTVASVYTPQVYLDDLDNFGNLDTLAFPLDSRVWRGGSPLLAFFDHNHKLMFPTGDTLEATLETGEVLNANGRRSFVGPIRVNVDAATGVSARVGTRDEQDKNDENITYSSYTTRGRDGRNAQRVVGRHVRFGVKIDAATTWDKATGIDVSLVDAGT